MRRFVLAWIGCMLTACSAKAFACGGDSECMLGGEPGVCIEGNCAYPDPACPSGYRYPGGAGPLGGSCAAGDGLGDTDTDTDTETGTDTTTGTTAAASSTTVQPTAGADSSTTQDIGATGSSSVADTGSGESTNGSTSTTTGGPICGELSCTGCASCVIEADGDCSAQAEACWALVGCEEASMCMIACAVDDMCTEDCCLNLSDRAMVALFELHACAAEVCVPACNLFEEPPCG